MDLDKMNTEKGINERFVECTININHILNNQSFLENKTILGYSRPQGYFMGKMNFRSTGFEETQSHAKVHQERINGYRKVVSHRKSHPRNINSNYLKVSQQRRMNQSTRKQRYLHAPTHEISSLKYSYLFYGHCYRFNIFGHKVFYCRRITVENSRYNKYQNFRSQNSSLRVRNPFSPLINDVECFKCNNFGHKVSECRRKFEYSTKTQNTWQPNFQKDKKNQK